MERPCHPASITTIGVTQGWHNKGEQSDAQDSTLDYFTLAKCMKRSPSCWPPAYAFIPTNDKS